MAVEKEYIVRVTKDVQGLVRTWRYQIDIVDPETELSIAYDWCSFKFMVNRTIKNLLKQQFRKDNPGLITEFRARATRK